MVYSAPTTTDVGHGEWPSGDALIWEHLQAVARENLVLLLRIVQLEQRVEQLESPACDVPAFFLGNKKKD